MSNSPQDATPSPVDPERLRALTTRRGEFVRETTTGCVGQLNGRAYELDLIGADLVLRTRWSRLLPLEAGRPLAQLVNDWNRDRILPTLFTTQAEDGLAVVAVWTASARAGFTDQQLAGTVDLALAAIDAAMSTLSASIPAPVPRPEPDHEHTDDERSDDDSGDDPRRG